MKEALSHKAISLCGQICRNLGWRPCDFWETTPAEIICILTDQSGSEFASLSRSELQEMMEQDKHG